jgi:hypothetical protein
MRQNIFIELYLDSPLAWCILSVTALEEHPLLGWDSVECYPPLILTGIGEEWVIVSVIVELVPQADSELLHVWK